MPNLSPEQWAEVRLLFEQVSALPPQSQAAFLEEQCSNEELRREVRSLLEYSSGGFETLHAEIAAEAAAVVREADPDQRLIGLHLGPYKVEAIVGHGGMGAVYRAARDDAEFHQQVAIKLVRPAMQSAETLERFKRERQILAHLAHRHIARLLGGGSTADGVPYLVMEFIEGEAITAWCRRHSLSIEQRLRLFLQVCEGVAFAHEHLVVHRDLKPGNILVTAEGTAKLLDFGIAKMLAPDAHTVATTIGTLAMTPEYAAPEQVRGEPVSRAVDVYALGLVLYEILTGHRAQKIPDPSPGTVARVICQSEPVSPASLEPALAGDLDNMIRMAIRKEPERRYASVADLARDIHLHLEKRPITARPDTLPYRAAKFLQRNRATVAGACITAVASAGLALAWWLSAGRHAPRASPVTLLTQTGHVELGRGLATDGSYVYFVERTPGHWGLARVSVNGGTTQPLSGAPETSEILSISPDRTRLLVASGVGDDVPLWAVPADGHPPHRLGDLVAHTAAWSPDGKSLVCGRGSALFLAHSDGSGLHKLLDTPGRPDHVCWAPTIPPSMLRYEVFPQQGTGWNFWEGRLWEVRADGARPHRLVPNWEPGGLHEEDSGTWISGGKYYVFRSVREGADDLYSIWALREGHGFLGLFPPHPVLIHSTPSRVFCPTLSPDGKRLYFISGQERREFVRYNLRRKEFVPFLPGKGGGWITFSKDGKWVAYTSAQKRGQDTLWRSRLDGSEAQQLTEPPMHVYEPHWSPDGAWIAFYASRPGQALGAYAIPSEGGTPQRLTREVSSSPSWSPDGSFVLLRLDPPPGGSASGLYLMDWKTREFKLLPESQNCLRPAWSPDGRHIAAVAGEQLQVFDTHTQRWTPLVKDHPIGLAFWSQGLPFWTKDGKYIYFQAWFQPEQPIFRVPAAGGKMELMMSSKQIPQSDLTAYGLAGLDPDDAPVAFIGRNNSEVNALDLDLP